MRTERRCRLADDILEVVLDLGLHPLGNGFLPNAETISEEYFYSLRCGFSPSSLLFQLIDQPSSGLMFHENYAFQSGTSRDMSDHFETTAMNLKRQYLDGHENPFVVEIGSNDGVFLRHLAAAGIRHSGVDPSGNVAEIAASAGVTTLRDFFSHESAARLAEDYGKANLIYAANALCHLPDIRTIAQAMESLLASDGVIVFEDPYLGDVIRYTSYDQIYDEHVFLFSAQSVSRIFGTVGMELVDVAPLPTHGGSMRYTLARRGQGTPSPRVDSLLRQEFELGLDRVETYYGFAERVAASASALHQLLSDVTSLGNRVVSYGATSKSTTVFNYARLGPDLVTAVFDSTPNKQGTLTPGMHIPVLPEQDFHRSQADYAFLGAWNHEKEIRRKNWAFEERGGRWITHVPEVRTIGSR